MRLFCRVVLALFFISGTTKAQQEDVVGGLVDRLFEILEIRHREILRTEENITHNRSQADRRALSRILKKKVRDYLRKDAQLEKVLEQAESTGDPKKSFLYRQSMDRLNGYRADIHQIQKLYFEGPLTPSPSVNTSEAGNFTEFVSSWEEQAPPSRRSKALLSTRDHRYFEHVKSEYMSAPAVSRSTARSDLEPAREFQDMVTDMQSEMDQKREALNLPARKPLDHYHQSLKHEATRGPAKPDKDTDFARFHSMLSAMEAGSKRTPIAQSATRGHSSMSVKDAHAELAVQTVTSTPVQSLIHDLQAYAQKSKPKKKRSYVSSKGNFGNMLAKLEKSRAQRELKKRKILSQPRPLQTTKGVPVQTPLGGVDRPSFETFRTRMDAPVEHVTVQASQPRTSSGEPRSGQSFAAFLKEVPQKTGSNQTGHGSPQNSTNRFEVILEDLKRANRGHAQADLPSDSFEEELQMVFTPSSPKSSKKATASVSMASTPQFLPDFDLFPKNTKPTQQGKVMPARQLSTDSSPAASPAVSQTTSTPNLKAPLASESSDLNLRARARLLRSGASLVPVRIEARDIKDRVYADLPIQFEVHVEPTDSIAAEILDASPASPLQRTVLTDSQGVAQIHLLLDTEGIEADISREMIVSREKTICRLKVTPRFKRKG